jgi:hypothetical protein
LFTVPTVNHKTNGESPCQRLSDPQVWALHTGLPRLDAFLGGFKPSTITLIDSNTFSFELLSMLCVHAIKVTERNVVFVDGGISFDPYAIATLSKRSRLHGDTVLSKIMIARGFTAYQLDALISDRLEPVIREHEPLLLIVSCVTDMLMDRAVREKEALTILRRDLSVLQRLTGEYKMITIITKRLRPPSSRASAFNEILYKGVDEIIEIKRKKKGIEIRSINHDLVMEYVPLSLYQTTLDDFIVIGGGAQNG